MAHFEVHTANLYPYQRGNDTREIEGPHRKGVDQEFIQPL